MENPHNIPHTKTPYFVPKGYFEHFPISIAEGIKAIYNADAPKLPSIALPYAIPDNYFENFTQNIVLQVKEANEVIHNKKYSFGKTNTPYSIPEGYFEQALTEIIQKVKSLSAQEELEIISPVLASISKEMPFAVPELINIQEVVEKATQPTLPKVVEMPVWRSLRITKWASAAAILLIFALGAYSLLLPTQNQPLHQEKSINALLADIPYESIEGYVYSHLDEYETDVEIYISSSKDSRDSRDEEFRTIIDNISEDELRDYLEI